MIQQKIDNALTLIQQSLANAKYPVALVSFGKDSMVMLWLIRQVAITPVVFFREAFQPAKFDFAESVIKAWDLDVRAPLPVAVDLVGRGDCLEILNVIALDNEDHIYLPIGINENLKPQADWMCGCAVLNKPVTDEVQWEWDVAFIGHKSSDVDPIQGPMPLPAASLKHGEHTFVFPLQDWTDENIWEASQKHCIPQNYMRYDPFDGFKELPDRTYNNDYHEICVECLKHGDSATVICPKVEAEVPRVGNAVDYETRADQWRQRFVNLSV